MTQKSVEIVIGKLASDEELRAAFRKDRMAALRALQQQGVELSALEVGALSRLEADELDRLAASLDPRLKRVSLQAALGAPLTPNRTPAR